MFHYCNFVERRLLLAAYLRGSATPKAQPSAATKARRKTNKADYPRSMHLRSVVRLCSWQFILCRGCFKALFAKAHKLPALESWTYDKLLGISLESSADVILADLGAAQGHRLIPWFRDFYKV